MSQPPAYPYGNNPQQLQFPMQTTGGNNQGQASPQAQAQGTNYSLLAPPGSTAGDPEEDNTAGEKKEEDEGAYWNGPGGVPRKFLTLGFANFFAEDKGVKTLPLLYKVVGLIYKWIVLILYNFLVIVVGIPFIIVWALTNGAFMFTLVWIWGPALRLSIISIYTIVPLASAPVHAFCLPLVDVAGRIFRQIRIQANVNRNPARGEEHIA